MIGGRVQIIDPFIYFSSRFRLSVSVEDLKSVAFPFLSTTFIKNLCQQAFNETYVKYIISVFAEEFIMKRSSSGAEVCLGTIQAQITATTILERFVVGILVVFRESFCRRSLVL